MAEALGARAVFRVALYYGFAGFGGGYSVLAQLRRDLVERRGLLSAEDFLVLAELSKSLPGTPATSLLALLGQRLGGARFGLIAAGAFLLPSTVLMICCGAAYSLVRSFSGLALAFDGMNAAMVGVVGAVTVDLARSALRAKRDVGLAVLCGALLSARVVSEPVVALTAVVLGAVSGALRSRAKTTSQPVRASDGPPRSERLHAAALPVAAPFLWTGSLTAIAGLVRVFVPIGMTTFGGGLAMIPAIEHSVVVERRWLDPKAFADAIALGQITPGPVAVCATFIGYRVAGLAGALAATVAMFLPATAIALAAGHWLQRFRGSVVVAGALRALAPAVIGMLGAATFSLGRAGLSAPIDGVIAFTAFGILVWRPIGPLWVLMGGALVRFSGQWI